MAGFQVGGTGPSQALAGGLRLPSALPTTGCVLLVSNLNEEVSNN